MSDPNREGTASQGTPWLVYSDTGVTGGDPWLRQIRLTVFRLVVAASAGGLGLLVLRAILAGDPFPWADLSNALFFGVIALILRKRPDWLVPLAWLGLSSFFLNAVEGLLPWTADPIRSVHILAPLLVLYGVFLGNLRLSTVAMVGVLTIYAFTWLHFRPLSRHDLLLLTNLCIVTVIAGLAGLAVWVQHRRLTEALAARTEALRRELDARLRLNAVISHDIRNPLTALMGASEMARTASPGDTSALDIIDQMAARITRIIRSTDDVNARLDIPLSTLPLAAIVDDLRRSFGDRLEQKGQSLVTTCDPALMVRTNAGMLNHSVLGNLVDNAIKFSPRGSEVKVCASRERDCLRIEVRGGGDGFPPEVLLQGGKCIPREGTEGERGSGHGLRIAALCLQRLQGRLELRNGDGGAEAAVVLPAA